jgi:hypothetical protein
MKRLMVAVTAAVGAEILAWEKGSTTADTRRSWSRAWEVWLCSWPVV